MDWKTIIIWIGVVAGLAQVLQYLEQSQLLRRLLPVLAMNAGIFGAIFNLCLIAILIVGVIKLGEIQDRISPADKVSPETIETNIRTWLDAFGITTKKVRGDDAEVHFELLVTMSSSGRRITIARAKKHDRYIAFASTLALSPESKAALGNITKEQDDRLRRDLGLELARMKMVYRFPEPLTVSVRKVVPITDGLTEHDFLTALDDVDFALTLVNHTMLASVDKVSKRGQ